MNAAREEVRMVHFTVDADWLTDLVRRLWADEGEVEKAFNILEAAFPEMDRETMLAILSGSKKLTGDSDGDGMLLEDDDAKKSPCGNLLDPKDVYARMHKRLRDAEATTRDMTDIATNDLVLMGSPKGAVRVPRNRVKQTRLDPVGRRLFALHDGVELEDIPHEECGDLFRGPYNPMFEDREEERPEPPPPSPEPKITSDTGWLSPEGKFYPCEYSGHVGLASRLGFDEPRLEKMGWIKMQTGKFVWDFLGHFEATQKQRDAIFDWTQERGEKMPWLGEEGYYDE